MATNFVQIENDSEIKKRLEAERMRLRKIAGLDQPTHFHRPIERAFTAEERNRVTILFGGFTWKHEDLIRAVFQGCGYRCEKLPVPDVPAFQIGKEYGNNGQCNPTYFTVGNLVQYLQFLEKEGIPRKDILDNYVFFTAGSCGPCRFGMYEAEYRFALKNAGFDGFRVLLFKDSDGIKAASGEPGLKFTVDFGFGMLNAMHLGDVFNDMIYQIRPFEVDKGETDEVFRETVDGLCSDLKNRHSFEIEQSAPELGKAQVQEQQDSAQHLQRLRQDARAPLGQGLSQRPSRCPQETEFDRSRSHQGEAGGEDHGRVLGADHRGRRQLPHVRLP